LSPTHRISDFGFRICRPHSGVTFSFAATKLLSKGVHHKEASAFPSGNSGGDGAVPDAKTSDFRARSRRSRICAEAYSCTPHKKIRRSTPRLPKSAVFGRELARSADAGYGVAGE
jgi:hypothetical protein